MGTKTMDVDAFMAEAKKFEGSVDVMEKACLAYCAALDETGTSNNSTAIKELFDTFKDSLTGFNKVSNDLVESVNQSGKLLRELHDTEN
jgi:hypothetical protein